jgi:hypothetical protein
LIEGIKDVVWKARDLANTIGRVRAAFAIESDRAVGGFAEVFDVGAASADDGAAQTLMKQHPNLGLLVLQIQDFVHIFLQLFTNFPHTIRQIIPTVGFNPDQPFWSPGIRNKHVNTMPCSNLLGNGSAFTDQLSTEFCGNQQATRVFGYSVFELSAF